MTLRTLLGLAFLLPVWALAVDGAPPFLLDAALTDTAGQPASLARYRGQPLVVNFWARWCGPCRTEIPDLLAARAAAGSRGPQVVGIALDDKPEAVRDFAKAYEIDYPVLLAQDNAIELLRELGNAQAGLPYTLVIDRQGNIVARKLGPMSRQEMAAAFRKVSR
jgi:peroxiredoxin